MGLGKNITEMKHSHHIIEEANKSKLRYLKDLLCTQKDVLVNSLGQCVLVKRKSALPVLGFGVSYL